MVFDGMGNPDKKKVGAVNLERFGRVAKYWRKAPSEYITGLDDFEKFVIDEACIVAVEADNKRLEKQRKEQEKENARIRKEKEEKEMFMKNMNKTFSGNDT